MCQDPIMRPRQRAVKSSARMKGSYWDMVKKIGGPPVRGQTLHGLAKEFRCEQGTRSMCF
ncbi:hypothetical protein BD779DRAFT_1555453 [Infundibulicybe gibba]|nr:hypothetical protein BD779DRAFT_1555453 [Infundibulicybe gibba]